MQARDVMSRGPIITVEPKTSIEEAARLMLSLGISGLPVVDASNGVVGILTEGDLLRRAELGTEKHRRPWFAFLASPGRLAAEYVVAHGSKVGEIMTTEVITADVDNPLDQIVKLMEKKRIRRAPIIERGRLAGIVSRADLMRALIARKAPATSAGHSDEEILAAVSKIFDDETWCPRATVRASVTDGIVDLWGLIFDERERIALRVAAENVAGVKAVRDHLTWVEPVSGMAIASGSDL